MWWSPCPPALCTPIPRAAGCLMRVSHAQRRSSRRPAKSVFFSCDCQDPMALAPPRSMHIEVLLLPEIALFHNGKKKIPNPLEILPSMRTYACYMHKLPLIPIRGPLINIISSRRLQGVWLCELSREPCMLSFLVDKNRVMFITTKDNRYCKYNNFMYSQIAI